ncbi:DEAD/DEAH box helicase [Planococcus sp. APC 4015]|nr:DEAD/DEAH box helicase [Planococcus sp. APC 4015]
MPKNKKPAGGRAAKNFEPRYGEKTSYQDRKRRPDAATGRPAATKPGSKSAGHRGHRPDSGEAPAKKRWTSQERAGRDEARGIRTHSQGERPARDERPRYNRDERPARPAYADRPARDDRAPRLDRVDRDDRRTFGDARPSFRRDDRGASARPARDDRSRGERPAYNRDERPARRDDDRSARPAFNRGERPAYNRGERPARPAYDRDERPARRDGDRPAYNRDERPARPAYNRDERPARPAYNRDERPARPAYNRDERPARPAYNRDERPARRDDDRPRRDSGSRAGRSDWAHAPGGSAQRASDAWRGRGENATPVRDKAHENRVDVVHERLQAEAVQAEDIAGVSFGDLGLGENIVAVLADQGAKSPFPIQAATIPAILEGRDVLARGRTGSGKTIAFGAPLVESILRSQAGKRREFGRSPKALILAPTRELALQIDGTIQPIARSVGLFTTQIYGGVPQGRQVGALKKGVDIIIGTPGRIEDLVKQGKLDLSDIQIVVLDEADHMCDLGFLEPVQRILRLTAPGSQKLLFSATLDREVAALVEEFLVEPAVHEVAGEDQDSSTIDHRILVIEHRDKAEILNSLVDREGKTLVFARTRAYAEMLAEQFDDIGINAVALHGDLNQAKRSRNLDRLTSGRVNVLVATDVAARGIHVDDIDLVIQADAPDEYKTYLHRSGRTGRAGRSGTVVTLITRQRRRKMTEMLDRAEIEAPFEDVGLGDDLLEELAGRQLSNVDA